MYLCIFLSDNSLIYPHYHVADEKVTVQFACSSQSKVRWTHSLTKVIFFNYNVKQLPNNTIVIQNVQKYNEGDYYCTGKTSNPVQNGLNNQFIDFHAKASLWIRGKNNYCYYYYYIQGRI